MFVGIGDAFVIFFTVFIFFRIRIRIAAAPKIFDEIFALLIGLKSQKGALFLLGDNVIDVGIQPTL